MDTTVCLTWQTSLTEEFLNRFAWVQWSSDLKGTDDGWPASESRGLPACLYVGRLSPGLQLMILYFMIHIQCQYREKDISNVEACLPVFFNAGDQWPLTHYWFLINKINLCLHKHSINIFLDLLINGAQLNFGNSSYCCPHRLLGEI